MRNKLTSKVFIIASVLVLAIIILFNPVYAQESISVDADIDIEEVEISVEFEADEITAESLGIKEPTILPGDMFYWWDNFKDNAKLFFTFDAVKKANLNLKFANKKLLQARRLAEKDDTLTSLSASKNADKYLEKALEVYDQKMEKLGERLKNVPEERKARFENTLERFNNASLQQEQVLRKLKDKLPEQVQEKLEIIRERTINRWYDIDKKNVKERLIKAAENNSIGSELKHLKNLASFEEFKEALPEDVGKHIEEAGEKIREELSEKLGTFKEADKEKFDKYINNIKLDNIKKYELISDLDNERTFKIILNNVKALKEFNLKRIERDFKNIDDDAKEELLKRLEKNIDVPRIEILKRLEISAPINMKDRIRSVNIKQETFIKEMINKTEDPQEIKILESKFQNHPTLLREVEQRSFKLQNMIRIEVKNASDAIDAVKKRDGSEIRSIIDMNELIDQEEDKQEESNKINVPIRSRLNQ